MKSAKLRLGSGAGRAAFSRAIVVIGVEFKLIVGATGARSTRSSAFKPTRTTKRAQRYATHILRRDLVKRQISGCLAIPGSLRTPNRRAASDRCRRTMSANEFLWERRHRRARCCPPLGARWSSLLATGASLFPIRGEYFERGFSNPAPRRATEWRDRENVSE